MKKYAIFIALFIAGLSLNAENYLIFKQKNDNEQALTLSSVVIKFADGQVQATDGKDALTLDLSTMQSLIFSKTPTTSIETVTNEEVQQQNMQVYDLNGRRVNAYDHSLQGVYIVKEGEKSRKILVR